MIFLEQKSKLDLPMNKLKTPIDTPRLVISPMTTNDVEFMFEILNSEGWLKNIGDRNIKTSKNCLNYINKILANPFYSYNVIRLRETNVSIGLVTLILRYNQTNPDVGFALLPHFVKKGYALEAAGAFLDTMRTLNQLEDIIGITLENNVDSIRLLEALGLKFQGKYLDNGKELCRYGAKSFDLHI